MPVDLSRVNVSLQQFQSISSGKYNAGEVRLESETELGKINHHVHLRGSNAKSISHAEVLAVKNAFVKALSDSGVGADEIAQIRRDLGLAAESGADTLGLEVWRDKLGVDGQQPFGSIVFLCALAKEPAVAGVIGANALALAEATSGLFAPDEQMAVGMITSALPAAM